MNRGLGAVAAMFVVVACSGTSGSGAGDACVPGASIACSGPGACAGFQVCETDGSGYAPCDCGSAGGLDGSVDGGADATTDATAGDATTDGQPSNVCVFGTSHFGDGCTFGP